MRILVTGVAGYIGSALAPRLIADGHEVRGFDRAVAPPPAIAGLHELVTGDAVTGENLERALDGMEVAYYLMHAMTGTSQRDFPHEELRAAERVGDAARAAGVRRVVYLGGLLPRDAQPSRHLASRLAVEEELLRAVPDSIAFRASIAIGARSRSFRFLVRLVERMPVMALPAWRDNRTQPIDGRDVLDYLTRAATAPREVAGRSWDIAGPDAVSYAELIDAIADAMLLERPRLELGFNLTPLASVVAAAVAGEDPGLVGPLMESLEYDLLPRDAGAAEAFDVRLHTLHAAIERALREMEDQEPG